MVLSSLFAAVLVLVTVTFANASDVLKDITPFSHVLAHSDLITAVRAGHSPMKPAKFTGSIDGGYKLVAGSGTFKGTFNGKASKSGGMGKLRMSVEGTLNPPGVNVKCKGNINAAITMSGKTFYGKAKFASRIAGFAHGKKIDMTCTGMLNMWASPKGFSGKETGICKGMYGGKYWFIKYTASISNKDLHITMKGTINKKRFYANSSISFVVFKETLDWNPMALKRIYGSVTTTTGGVTNTQKFELKGDQLLPSSA